MDGAGLSSYLMQTSMCTIQLHSQLFKCLFIETEEDKVKYSEDLQREYRDETNIKRHNVKNAVRSKYKSE